MLEFDLVSEKKLKPGIVLSSDEVIKLEFCDQIIKETNSWKKNQIRRSEVKRIIKYKKGYSEGLKDGFEVLETVIKTYKKKVYELEHEIGNIIYNCISNILDHVPQREIIDLIIKNALSDFVINGDVIFVVSEKNSSYIKNYITEYFSTNALEEVKFSVESHDYDTDEIEIIFDDCIIVSSTKISADKISHEAQKLYLNDSLEISI